MSRPRAPYHHGDLRRSLVEGGLRLVEEIGVESMTLQKLAKHCGVSAPALYHHFHSKDDLLQELGTRSLALFEEALAEALGTPETGLSLPDFAVAYVTFALRHPELYELMFGRVTWIRATPPTPSTAPLHARARQSFRAFGERMAEEQRRGRIPRSEDPLRLSQVVWATLHGLCRMHNDGLAFSKETITDIALHAAKLLQPLFDKPRHKPKVIA
jgi:AcrR family transcriptional regulator